MRKNDSYGIDESIVQSGYMLDGKRLKEVPDEHSSDKQYLEAFKKLNQWAYENKIFEKESDDGYGAYDVHIIRGQEEKDFADLFKEAASLSERLDYPKRAAWILATGLVRKCERDRNKGDYFMSFEYAVPSAKDLDIPKLKQDWDALENCRSALETTKDKIPPNLSPEHLVEAGCRSQTQAKFFLALGNLLDKELLPWQGGPDSYHRRNVNVISKIMRQFPECNIGEVQDALETYRNALKQRGVEKTGVTPLALLEIGSLPTDKIEQLIDCSEAYLKINSAYFPGGVPDMKIMNAAAEAMTNYPDWGVAGALTTFKGLKYEGLDRDVCWNVSSDIWREA